MIISPINQGFTIQNDASIFQLVNDIASVISKTVLSIDSSGDGWVRLTNGMQFVYGLFQHTFEYVENCSRSPIGVSSDLTITIWTYYRPVTVTFPVAFDSNKTLYCVLGAYDTEVQGMNFYQLEMLNHTSF